MRTYIMRHETETVKHQSSDLGIYPKSAVDWGPNVKCLRVCGTFLISTYLSKATHYPFERLYKKVFCFVYFPEYKLGRFSAHNS